MWGLSLLVGVCLFLGVGWFDWFSMMVCLGVLVWVFGLGWLVLCWLMFCVGCWLVWVRLWLSCFVWLFVMF